MRLLVSYQYKTLLTSIATICSRFSLGATLAIIPLLVANYFGNELAKNVALAINLSSYSSWLVLGGYATVMRDHRLAQNKIDMELINNQYKKLASLQCVGAIILTVLLASFFIIFLKPSYLNITSFILSLLLGVVVQCTSFWLNIVLGFSYAMNKFISVNFNVSILRFTSILIFLIGINFSKSFDAILLISSIVYIIGSIGFYLHYMTINSALVLNNNTNDKKRFMSLLKESLIYFNWSLFSTAVFLLPVSAAALIAPDLLLPITFAFFLAGANQNLVAALITPQANILLDGIGNLKALQEYYLYTLKTSLLVTSGMILLGFCIAYFGENFIKFSNYKDSIFLTVLFVGVSGLRSLTLATTQAAITLKMEKLVSLSPLFEAVASILGVVTCWYFSRGEWITYVFLVAVVVRLIAVIQLEYSKININWKNNI